MSTMTNKQGFPIETCDRCQGSGKYSFNMVHGSMCFGCSGSGTVIVKRAAEAWKMYQAEVKQLRRPLASQLQVGDLISHDKVWRRIGAIEVTDEPVAWVMTGKDEHGNKVMTPTDYRMIVTIEAVHKSDLHLPEATLRLHGNELVRRGGRVDPSKYLAMIPNERGDQ
jgi:hypothetical protein